jgi:hypothetical protein
MQARARNAVNQVRGMNAAAKLAGSVPAFMASG